MPTKWTREQMFGLADLLMEETCSDTGKPAASAEEFEALRAALLENTGWTVSAFEELCDRRWNGPVWAR